jgi:hypothetical protein
MATDSKPLQELNAQAEQAVEETKEQALGAADTYFDFLQKTISSFPSGGTEVGEKLKSYAERNVASTREFIKHLSRAKDFEDALRIQTEFMHAQMQAFGEQTTTILEAFTKSATSAVKPPFKTSLE